MARRPEQHRLLLQGDAGLCLDELGVRAVPAAVDLVPGLEVCVGRARRLDRAGEVGAEEGRLRAAQPGHGSRDPGRPREAVPIEAVDGRRTDTHEHLLVLWLGHVHLARLDHGRRAVPLTHHRFHRHPCLPRRTL